MEVHITTIPKHLEDKMKQHIQYTGLTKSDIGKQALIKYFEKEGVNNDN